MGKDTLDEKEFEVINMVGLQMASNQRDLSRHLDLSLGAVNMLVKKLIAKGYIKIVHLNKRKVQYLLTPQGFSEKMRKSVNYTRKTINSIGLIKDRIKEILSDFHKEGERKFFTFGESDLSVLVEMAFREAKLHDAIICPVNENSPDAQQGILFLCKEGEDPQDNGHKFKKINLIEELAKDESLVNHNSTK